MSRSYVTVRALVLIVTLLVIIEYFSLMQSAENADKRAPVIFRIVVPDGRDKYYHRHVLQTLDPGLYSGQVPGGDQVTLARWSNTTTLAPDRPVTSARLNTTQCPIIPPALHGRFPVQVSVHLIQFLTLNFSIFTVIN